MGVDATAPTPAPATDVPLTLVPGDLIAVCDETTDLYSAGNVTFASTNHSNICWHILCDEGDTVAFTLTYLELGGLFYLTSSTNGIDYKMEVAGGHTKVHCSRAGCCISSQPFFQPQFSITLSLHPLPDTLPQKTHKMFKVPTFLAFVLAVGGLVAVSSILAFDITSRNAVSSIRKVSLDLSESIITTTYKDIARELIHEQLDYVKGMKYGVELGNYNHTHCNDVIIQNGIEFKNHTPFAALGVYMDDASNMGCIVDMEGPSVAQLQADKSLRVTRGFVPNTMSWNISNSFVIPLNILTRPYYTILADNPDVVQQDIPIWSSVWVSVNPNVPSPGLQVSLTWPVLWPDRSFRGGVMASTALVMIDLSQYQITPDSILLLMETDHSLITSTTHEVPFTEPEPKVYERYTLSNCGVPILREIGQDTSLLTNPVLPHSVKLHQEFSFEGKGYWLQMKEIENLNLRWVILMTIPEAYFFEEIDDSNATTRLIVIFLIVGTVLVAAALSFVFVYPIRKVAVAFDKIAEMETEAMEIERVPHNSIFREIDSLYKGFWTALDMLKKVKAFLPQAPQEDLTEAEDTETTTEVEVKSRISASTPSSISRLSYGTQQNTGLQLGLGVKLCRGAVCAVLDVSDFSKSIDSDKISAQTRFERFFTSVNSAALCYSGRITVVQGGKLAVTWMIASCDAKAKAVEFGLALPGLTRSGGGSFKTVSIGIYACKSYSGIMGDSAHRHSVVGSTLVDGASALASLAQHMALPLVVAGPILANLPQAESFQIAAQVYSHYGSLSGCSSASYVSGMRVVPEGEWMYQLDAMVTETASNRHLTEFFEKKKAGERTQAQESLTAFEQTLEEDNVKLWRRALLILAEDLEKAA